MTGRVLIADAVPTNRIILKVKLAASRYEVTQADSVSALLETARQALPDLIIIDQSLPEGGIAGACKALRADPTLAAIPVIALAALDLRRDRLNCLRAGADDVLTKPLDELALLALVRNLIRARVSYCELARKKLVAQEFGFADGPKSFQRQVRIALVPPSREAGFGWRSGLVGKVNANVRVVDKTDALDHQGEDTLPDIFVVSAKLSGGVDGLQLISELRSNTSTRHAVLILHNPTADCQTTTLALDMGANAVLDGEYDGEELALRLTRLAARKLETDHLRNAIDQQLSLAITDPLTGLYNRRYAQSYLMRIAQNAHQQRQPFTLMILDLDRFKRVNDQFGHAVGDDVLVEVAARLKANLREVDLLARLGGEEFLVAMPETDQAGAARAAERLRRIISDTPIQSRIQGLRVPVTLSIGVVVSPNTGGQPDPIDRIMDRADRALYRSKADGRNQITFVRTAA